MTAAEPRTPTLVEFLLARIREDETSTLSGECRCEDGATRRPDCGDRVLSECAAKRRIVELHRGVEGDCPTCSDSGWVGAVDGHMPVSVPCPTLRALASVYDDHPDYRAEWAS